MGIGSKLASWVAGSVGPAPDVLGLVCARRGFLEALSNQGSRVLAIEYAADAADVAMTSSNQVLVGDLEQLDLPRELADRRFDALVVDLGYVARPTTALTILKQYLREGGAIVAVAPNATFAATALALLRGDDPDCPAAGAEQRLRHYTRQSLEHLLDESELVLGSFMRYVEPPISATELEELARAVRPELVRALLDDGEARTSEFIGRAHVLPMPGLRWIQSRMRELVTANAAATQEVAAADARLDELRELARSAMERETESRKLLLEAHEQLLERDAELAAAGAVAQERTLWAKNLDRELSERHELIRNLQVTVEERTEWARRLDAQLAEQSELIQELQSTVNERTEWAHRLDGELAEQAERIQELQGPVNGGTERGDEPAGPDGIAP